MKKVLLVLSMLFFILPTIAEPAYLGAWKIDDNLTVVINTHIASTGGATDATGSPTYRVYEDETGAAILNGTFAKLDDANTTGFYSEQVTLSAGNGFEKGKSYSLYASAVVGSQTGTTGFTFQIEAEVDANTVSPTVSADAVSIFGSSAAAELAALGHNLVYSGRAETGTLSTTQFTSNLDGLTENDSPLGRLVFWAKSSTMAGEFTRVTGYTKATGLFTVTEMKRAPANTDLFLLR